MNLVPNEDPILLTNYLGQRIKELKTLSVDSALRDGIFIQQSIKRG